jgi:23S rRNA (guanosine2251-2'-O)-methyltransferase
MRAGNPIHQADLTQPLALLLGGEEKGIYPALLKAADGQVHIPMTGDFDSLNVSVATGMMLYEAMKQRSNG